MWNNRRRCKNKWRAADGARSRSRLAEEGWCFTAEWNVQCWNCSGRICYLLKHSFKCFTEFLLPVLSPRPLLPYMPFCLSQADTECFSGARSRADPQNPSASADSWRTAGDCRFTSVHQLFTVTVDGCNTWTKPDKGTRMPKDKRREELGQNGTKRVHKRSQRTNVQVAHTHTQCLWIKTCVAPEFHF